MVLADEVILGYWTGHAGLLLLPLYISTCLFLGCNLDLEQIVPGQNEKIASIHRWRR